MNVRKRDGSIEEYSTLKIKEVVCRAYESAGEACDDNAANVVIDSMDVYDGITTESLRTQIEDALMGINKRVAKSYISSGDERDEEERQFRKKTDFIRDYLKATNAATGSKYDSNANVSIKNITTLSNELYKYDTIMLNRKRMYERIKMLYSKKLADQYIADLENKIIYKHDETSIFPYCVAVTMYPFLVDGLTKLGGQSTAPTDLKSFCGEFINFVYSVSSQFAGACMYKEQPLLINDNGVAKKISAKEFVNQYLSVSENKSFFENWQGTWEYCKLPQGVSVLEDGKMVDVVKVYRRRYNDKIYKISTKDGCTACVSKDHIFKRLYHGEVFEAKAETLSVGNTVYVNKDYTSFIDFKRDDVIGVMCGDGSFPQQDHGRDICEKNDIIDSIEIFDNDDEFVYEIETSSHWYNCGGFITHNCATPEFLLCMDYFIRKDYGDDYIYHLDEKVELNRKGRTLEQVIENCFQQVVHSMNMPAGNRGYQSVFWNVGYFDKPYFDGVFGDFRFPDGSRPVWNTLSWLQKRFMTWFNTERERYVLTFPVETMAMLTDGNNDFVDKEYADFTAEMWSKGHSFFVYLSNSPDSLSSCCFHKEQKVIWKTSYDGVHLTTLEELHNTKWEPYKKNLTIFHNGSWVNGKSVRMSNRDMYSITTFNNKNMIATDNHIHVTLEGEKKTTELTTDDYILFNTSPLCGCAESDEHLTYNQGFVVGMFLGDGSFGTRHSDGTVYEVNFSLNAEKFDKCKQIIEDANKELNGTSSVTLSTPYNNVYPTRISSKNMVQFIKKWTEWEDGTRCYNKKLNMNCLLQSIEFRRGILDGWYATDGGNSNRCYTTSSRLVECMEGLITSLGMNSIINTSDRTSETCVIREESFNRNYPLYCVRWYEPSNHRTNKDVHKSWIKRNNSIYFKIKTIEPYQYNDDVYCIECNDSDEPYFTLPNGIITHNCRLRNSLKDMEDEEHNHTTHQFSMGTASVATGSKAVITLNLNRAIQDAVKEYCDESGIPFEKGHVFSIPNIDENVKADVYSHISKKITEKVSDIHKYLTAFNSIVKDFLDADALTVYNGGFITMNKQYLTVGVNGLTDAAEFLDLTITDNTGYEEFVNVVLETINKCNKADKSRSCMFNTEFVPGENLSKKNYSWDEKDGYFVSPKHIMYSSYFFNPEDENLSVIDKMKLHGARYVQYLDGGSACHINLQEHLTKEQYRHLLSVAAENGTNYFTFNVRNTVCNDCGHISKHTLDKCPKCGSENLDYLTRIIGYLKRVSSFSEARQKEECMRHYNG